MERARTIFERHIDALREQCDALGEDNFVWTLLHLVERRHGRKNPQIPLAIALNPKGSESDLLERYEADYFERLADVALEAAGKSATKAGEYEKREKTRVEKAAKKRHRENHQFRQTVIEHYAKNKSKYQDLSADAVAEKIAGTIVPVTHRTVVEWIYSIRRQPVS